MIRSIFGRMSGWALAPLLCAASAFAEPPSEVLKTARKRFQEGVAAVDAGNYEAARVAFQQAYALKPHPSALRNLGQAELRTGHYLEAARHLSRFLRETTFGSAAERDVVIKSLAQAEAEVAKVVVEVDVVGADITLDGELLGRSPTREPFYAEAGERMIRIKKDGYEPYVKSQVLQAGRTTQLRIALDVPRAPALTASTSPFTGSFGGLGDGSTSGSPDGAGIPPHGPVSVSDSAGSARTIALATTGGLTLISAGVWLGFSLRGASLEHDAERLRSQIANQHADSQCSRDEAPCSELRDVSNQRAAANTIAMVGGIATGVAGAGFAATLLFWPKASKGVALPKLVPDLSPSRAGLALIGGF
jgi:hypothetical protein